MSKLTTFCVSRATELEQQVAKSKNEDRRNKFRLALLTINNLGVFKPIKVK